MGIHSSSFTVNPVEKVSLKKSIWLKLVIFKFTTYVSTFSFVIYGRKSRNLDSVKRGRVSDLFMILFTQAWMENH